MDPRNNESVLRFSENKQNVTINFQREGTYLLSRTKIKNYQEQKKDKNKFCKLS